MTDNESIIYILENCQQTGNNLVVYLSDFEPGIWKAWSLPGSFQHGSGSTPLEAIINLATELQHVSSAEQRPAPPE